LGNTSELIHKVNITLSIDLKMAFSKLVKREALIACQRFCCLCHERKHTRITCHHIIQEADGGEDTLDNCIPLCPNCHSEVKAYDQRHNIGASPYSPEELRRRRDDWFQVIRRRSAELQRNLTQSATLYPISQSLSGRVNFDYESHDGFHIFGSGKSEFLMRFSGASNSSIHAYTDQTNVSIALAPPNSNLYSLISAESFDFSSRCRTPKIDEFLIAENNHSRYAAFLLREVASRSHGHDIAQVVFDYWILEDGTSNFSLCNSR
jgi:hypothetical protein